MVVFGMLKGGEQGVVDLSGQIIATACAAGYIPHQHFDV